MANSQYSYYFTVVTYPDEFTRMDKLLDLGYVYLSPIHYAHNKPTEETRRNADTTQIITAPNEWTLYTKQKKRHVHVLVKTANKMTENKFIEKLSNILDNDFTGIAVKKDDTLVSNVGMMLRYFYHLDNPNKEHFNVECAFENVAPCFTKEVVSAFQVEITHIITERIMLGEFNTMRDILEYNSLSLVFEEYLRCTKNLYYVRNLFLDERYLEQRKKENKNNEKINQTYCLSNFS